MKSSSLIRALIVMALFVVIILVAGFYSAAVEFAREEGFVEGIYVDNMHLHGMQEEEAKSALQDAYEARTRDLFIEISCAEHTARFTYADAGATLHMEDAFASIRELMAGDFFTDIDTKMHLREGFETYTYVTFDKQALQAQVEKFAEKIEVPAQDATVQFSSTGEFTFADGKNGRTVDANTMTDALFEKFQQENYEPLHVEPIPVAPAITKEVLQAHTEPLGTCTTIITGSAERVTNICMITDTVNGRVIPPGEVLALNELTGERTEEKGYKEAPAIRYGELIEELGGGICQLSGTLFNAALLSDMEIVERHHHTWPSDYLPVGMDATITWPNKDLKVRNTTQWPMYVHATVDGENLNVTFYGGKKDPELRIELENDIYEEQEPPAPVLIKDATRPVGYKRVVTKARKGYKVKLYRHYYRGDALVETELIHHDRFRAITGKQVIGTYVEPQPVLPFDEDK